MKKTIITCGKYVLDTILVREYPQGPEKQRVYVDRVALKEIGGTCGNVATMLPSFGDVEVFPIMHFDDSEIGLGLTADLVKYGCDTRFVKNSPNGGTTIYTFTRKLDKEGNRLKAKPHTSRPDGSMFPNFAPMLVKEVPGFLDALEFVPDVFFYDMCQASFRDLAMGLREKGTLVYFEPERIHGVEKKSERRAEMKCIAASDIVKFSDENVADISFLDEFQDKLFIQTMGCEGIRFKLRDGGWLALPPVVNENVVDTEGAGDWTTSTFINFLCKNGLTKVSELTEEQVVAGLKEAQKVASASVSYFGSKGMLHPEII